MTFIGASKTGHSLLHYPEQRFIRWFVPKIPPFIHSYHLTLASIPISLCIVLFGFFAKTDTNWLLAISFLIIAQWFTDSLDGSLGRYRKEGLIRWGYYMDHFLDYIFLCSVLISYSLMLPDEFTFLHFFVLAIFGGFMIQSFLAVPANEEFRITHLGIGPTEIRIVFILVNLLIVFFGKTHMVTVLPYILGFATMGLVYVVYQTQDLLFKKDKSRIKIDQELN